MKFFSDFRLLLLAIWLGAAVFFIAVAQSAFAVLPQREMAGAVVGRTLVVLNFGGLAIFALLLLTSFLGTAAANRFWLWLERILLLITALACAVGQFVFGVWISLKHAEIGRPVDELAADDPLRLQFDMLHEYSVWTLIVGMSAALIAFFVIANRKFTKKTATNDPYNFEKEFKV
ncbi:MAG: DUF4149 domain-containing protein [Pyrinomonadaceae bacterium]